MTGSLTTFDHYRLDQAVLPIRRAFDQWGGGTYLVGSAAKSRDARDVDVRTIVDDHMWDALFGPFPLLWEALCLGLTSWLREQTGLPIDYQVQRLTEANEQHSVKDGHFRSALGIGYSGGAVRFAGGGDATVWVEREKGGSQ